MPAVLVRTHQLFIYLCIQAVLDQPDRVHAPAPVVQRAALLQDNVTPALLTESPSSGETAGWSSACSVSLRPPGGLAVAEVGFGPGAELDDVAVAHRGVGQGQAEGCGAAQLLACRGGWGWGREGRASEVNVLSSHL